MWATTTRRWCTCTSSATASDAIRRTNAFSDRRGSRQNGAGVSLLVAIVVALVVCPTWTGGAWAAAPLNDAFDTATPIAQLPFSDTLDMSEASIETGEPQFCNYAGQSVWYAITPRASGLLAANAARSSGHLAYPQLTAYRADGAGLGGLSFLACQNYGDAAIFEVEAGTTYYLQASTFYQTADPLEVHVETTARPANDDFASATRGRIRPVLRHLRPGWRIR